MAEDLPFQAEYAKTGRANCKGCKTPIPQGNLRIAAMVQSAFFDGKQANWFHENCFFMKQRPKSIADIGNYGTLRHDDQKRLQDAIESNSSGIVMPVAKAKGKKAVKRGNTDDAASVAALKDFSVEYSKSSRATCKVCEIKITKGEVRISKKVFDTEIGQKFGGQALWHHIKCFAENRSQLLYFAGGEMLPGFNSLKKEDKEIVKKEIKALKQDEVPVKKLKDEPKDKDEKKIVEKEEKDIITQNKLFYKYRDSLKKNMSKADLKYLLEFNHQEVPAGEDRILDRLADIMAFGTLLPCSVCKDGQLVLGTSGYTCTGNITEWTKCQVLTQSPKRKPFKVPTNLKDSPTFSKYKFKAASRIFRKIEPTLTIKSEAELLKSQPNRPVPPLKNLDFFILGYSAKAKEEIKIKILKLGGNVSSEIHADLVAVVSTQKEVDSVSSKMKIIEDKEIIVIEDTFLNDIKENGSVSDTLDLIWTKNISGWGKHPKNKLSKDIVDGKSVPKSGSLYKSKSASGTKKLKVIGGSAVDPDSGLDDVAQVYKDTTGVKYSIVLGLTDVITKKNSYYKLQVLKSVKQNKFWLFRSWGRIGTTIGGNKTDSYRTLNEAKIEFERLYFEKTENTWVSNKDEFVKVPGKMYPIEMDYGEDEPAVKALQMDDKSSTLPAPVQGLIKMLFDVEVMKKVMLEFELDTEKMPLGKLSRKQLLSGYKVLTEVQKILSDSKAKENKQSQARIIDATNRFYTLIPHDFGVDNPPLLNEEIIKIKTSMLDNLLELEIAYNMMKTGSDVGSPLDTHYIQLKSEIIPVDAGSPEYQMALKYVTNTHAATHSGYQLEILQLFKVAREGEDKRFKPFRKLPNRRLLWHGSRVTNFPGILSQGLRIAPPEAPVTGYMFGKGIYFADMVSKSANYCCTNMNSPIGVMMLCEVALGEMHELMRAEFVTKLPPGKHSVKGVGRTEPDSSQEVVLDCGTIVPLGTPINKSVQSSLLYNEYIVYDVAQVNVKYLFQMKFKYNF